MASVGPFELQVLGYRLAVCRLPAEQRPPAWLARCPFYALVRTSGELSLVVPDDYAPDSWQVERGWRALEVAGPLEFSLVGVLAELAGALALAGVSLFALSTFSTDLLLVREGDLTAAREALASRGHTVRG